MFFYTLKRGVKWQQKHKYGKLVIDLQIKTKALEQGLNTAKQKLKEIENSNNSLENSNKSLDASFIAMSATAVVALNQIGNAIKSCINEYNNYTQAMSGLQNIANYTGQDMDKLTDIMNKFTKYGLTQTDIATAIKNFSLMGYTAEETEQMIMALTESAISNRQACYSVSEAVKMASEGYKNGISTLSDAAGVTENLSVMESKYAESIGKTAGQLTEAEKNQAYLNRTMEAAAPFAGATAQYMETLAGKQGEYSQALRETQVAYTEALEPTLVKIEEMKTTMLTTLSSFISQNEEATAGVTAFVVTLGILGVAVAAVKKAYDSYKTSAFAATAATKGFTAALTANPVGLVVTGITLLISSLAGLSAATETQKQKQAELNELQREHNEIMQGTIELNNENVESIKSTKEEMEAYLAKKEEYNENNATLGTIKESGLLDGENSEEIQKIYDDITNANIVLASELVKTSDAFKEQFNIQEDGLVSTEKITGLLEVYTDRLEEAESMEKIKKAMDTESIKTEQKQAAQLKINANQMQKYLDTVKKGNKSSTEYQTAVKKLAEAYPEAANAQGIVISTCQDYINAEKAKADQAWNTSQATIQGNINVINSFIDLANAAANDVGKQQELANAIGISYENIIPTLSSVLSILQAISGQKPEEVKGVEPVDYTPTTPSYSSGSSSVYENKKLDNYKALIEYKKSMDQISLKQEISMYQKALNSYAKTTEEKRELRTKIYELNKELAQKEKDMLDQQTEDYEAYIQEQINNRGAAYDVKEQTKDYDAIIKMHKKYLNQIMDDERLSLDERKELYREELETIRDYEQQKRDLRVENIDDTVSQLTDAITKQLEELQEKDKEMIDKNLEEVEKWKEARINAINEEYDARIEAIDKELEALNKAEEQKSRDEEDSEYEQKKKRLEELIAFEHDATNKANYQKELDKLVADYQKKLDERALQDKKDALEEQKDKIQEEQDAQIEAIENEAEKRKEAYEQQLEELEKYYDEQIDMAQQTAEQMLLNVEDNQKQILDLLKNYGDAYEITGQSLGEKLAQGINEGAANKIENIIQKIQDTIDKNIETQIKEWTKGSYSYNPEQNKPQVTSKTINVYQTNNIEQNPELPSETYRKLKNIDEELAAQLVSL